MLCKVVSSMEQNKTRQEKAALEVALKTAKEDI